MRKQFLVVIALATSAALISAGTTHAQQSTTGRASESDEIVIRKKGDKDSKVTVEFKDGQVTINGKPMQEYNNEDVIVSRRRSVVGAGRNSLFTTPVPPTAFRGGTLYNDNGNQILRGMINSSNKALLGVLTEKNDGGAKITSVSKSSAAEKGGLKEGDIITKIDNAAVAGPEDLTAAIGKYKPEDKATITYKRDNKEQKAAVTLGKRQDATAWTPDGFSGGNFNFDMLTPGQDGGYNYVMRGNNLRLGLKAQDTEDGKGVKVLDVDDASNAAKAGIKEGDIITEFNEKSVNSTGDLMEAAKDMKDKSTIKVKLTRDGKSQEMEIRVPKRLKTATL